MLAVGAKHVSHVFKLTASAHARGEPEDPLLTSYVRSLLSVSLVFVFLTSTTASEIGTCSSEVKDDILYISNSFTKHNFCIFSEFFFLKICIFWV